MQIFSIQFLIFHRVKAANHEGRSEDNNGINVWNKLETDVADSYSPPVLENSDVPDLQRNRVSME